MGGNGRVDQVATEAPKARERAIFVGPCEPGVADDVRNQDRRDFPRFRHGAPSDAVQDSTSAAARRRLRIESDGADGGRSSVAKQRLWSMCLSATLQGSDRYLRKCRVSSGSDI